MLISAVQQNELAICVHRSPPSWTSSSPPPSPSLWVTTEHLAGLSALYGRFPLAILHIVVYVALQKEMATHSSLLAGKPHGQRSRQSMGSQRVGHDSVTKQQQQCIHINSIFPPLPSPHIHVSILYVWVSIPTLLIGSFISFSLDSAYMH